MRVRAMVAAVVWGALLIGGTAMPVLARAEDDLFRRSAVNLRTGEICGGRAVWTA